MFHYPTLASFATRSTFPLALVPYLWHNIPGMRRWIGFFIAMAIGAAGGLFYGWVVDPVKYIDTTPNSLRIDYQSDVTLMVAEIYKSEQNLPNAIQRLKLLGDNPPAELVSQALAFGQEHGYSQSDLENISALLQAVRSWNPMLGTLTP